jgi:hypothetical protein
MLFASGLESRLPVVSIIYPKRDPLPTRFATAIRLVQVSHCLLLVLCCCCCLDSTLYYRGKSRKVNTLSFQNSHNPIPHNDFGFLRLFQKTRGTLRCPGRGVLLKSVHIYLKKYSTNFLLSVQFCSNHMYTYRTIRIRAGLSGRSVAHH